MCFVHHSTQCMLFGQWLVGLAPRARWTRPKVRKPTPIMRSPSKNKIQFFWTRLPTSLDGFNSSLAQSADELWSCKGLQEKWRTQDLKDIKQNLHKFFEQLENSFFGSIPDDLETFRSKPQLQGSSLWNKQKRHLLTGWKLVVTGGHIDRLDKKSPKLSFQICRFQSWSAFHEFRTE